MSASNIILNIIKDQFTSETKILDLGCGAGDLVYELKNLNYDVYGTDIAFKKGEYTENLIKQGRLSFIECVRERSDIVAYKKYRIPHSHSKFDVVVSDQTIEHVENLDKFVSESKRVLQKNGVFIGYYPSGCKLREAHTGIPLGGVIKYKIYTKICFKLKLKYKKFKIYDNMLNYMNTNVFYRSDKEIKKVFLENGFNKFEFEPELILKYKNTTLSNFIRIVPFGSKLFGKIWSKLFIAYA